MNKFNYALSVKSKLLNISRSERIVNQTILTRYFHERFLYRLSVSPFRTNFILKGGALIYAHESHKARPTLDIDFLGCGISRDFSTVRNTVTSICQIPCVEDGVIFYPDTIILEEITLASTYNGVRVRMDASLDTVRQLLSMDIGFGDVIIPAPVNLNYPLLIGTLPDFNIAAYSLESVIAEKIHAMIDRSVTNSRMKDFFDVYTLLKTKDINTELLRQAVHSTFLNRETSLNLNNQMFDRSFAEDEIRKRMWNSYLRKVRFTDKLPFAIVWEFIVNQIRVLIGE